MRPTTPIRRRVRALARPLGVLLVCAIALPQALARSSEHAATAAAHAKGAPRVKATTGVAGSATTAAGIASDASAAERRAARRLFRRIAKKATRRLARAAARRALPPPVVRRIVRAGNRIARAPYTYGGGHGNWNSGGYDCSGSVSYALHGGGLLDTALDSGGFMSWGEPGPGRWITIYANPGHAFMVVAGRRFDTTGREQSGSRWQTAMRDTSGYVVRHPRGL